MKRQQLASRTKSLLQATAFGALFFFILFCALGAGPMWAEEAPGSGTIPPLASFSYRALPPTVQQGDVVTYQVTIVDTDTTYVNVVLGLTSTLPSGVSALADTVQASIGVARVTAAGQVTWTAAIQQPGDIFIRFQARVAPTTCGDKVSRAQLYEIENVGAGKPSSSQLTDEATFKVEGSCSIYLPHINRSLSPIPTLQNWNFEEGAASGWGQFDNGQPNTLIYSTDRKSLPMPQGGKWFGWLAGVLNKTSELRQQKITLPADHSGIQLRFLYMIESADDCGINKDNGYVLLNGVQISDTFQLCKEKVTSTWQTAKVEIPSTWWGRDLTLALQSKTNGDKYSSWFVDNVTFCSTDERAAVADRCPEDN